MRHWQVWSGSHAAETLIENRLELASLFQFALDAHIMAIIFGLELIDVPIAT